MHTWVVVNADAGTVRSRGREVVEDLIHEALPDALVAIVPAGDYGKALASAFEDPAVERVIAGGGDGSLSFAAAQAVAYDTPLGVLPLGTMNLFARTLEMPLGLDAALKALATAREVQVDIADIDGKVVLNHVSLGLHANVIRVRDRETHTGQLHKMWGSAKAFWQVAQHPGRLDLEYRLNGNTIRSKTALALITVNPIETGPLPIRPGQSEGELGVYVATGRYSRDIVRLAAKLAAGNWHTGDQFDVHGTHAIEVAGEPVAWVSIDGEVDQRKLPFTVRIRRGALRALAPVAA